MSRSSTVLRHIPSMGRAIYTSAIIFILIAIDRKNQIQMALHCITLFVFKLFSSLIFCLTFDYSFYSKFSKNIIYFIIIVLSLKI
jgi:hypothetical protein